MRTMLRTALMALFLIAAPAMGAGAASATTTAGSAPFQPAHVQTLQQSTASSGGVWALSASNPTPSPGDSASTGPANPGTGESGQAEATRLDYTPYVIGGVVLAALIVILLWQRRRNKTIV